MKQLSFWLLAAAVAMAAGAGVEGATISVREKFLPSPESNETLTFDQDDLFSVGDIKARIQSLDGTPRSKLHLLLDERELADSEPLRDLRTLASFSLVRDLYQVQVRMPGGETVTLQVEPCDSVASVKERLSPLTDGRRILKLGDQELEDNRKLGDFVLLTNKSVLVLSDSSRHPIDRNGEVRVRLPSGEVVSFRARNSMTVSAFKEIVRHVRELAQGELSLQLDGKELANEELLLSYGPHLTSTPMILSGPVPSSKSVYVQLKSGRLLTYKVEPNETVASLKARISWSRGIPGERQHLFRGNLELANNKLVSQCAPEDKPVLQLTICSVDDVEAKHVHVLLNDFSSIFSITPEDTLENLKSMIRDERSVPQDLRLHLTNLKGDELVAGQPLVEQILEGGSFVMARTSSKFGPFLVHVRLQTGDVITFEASPIDTVASVKRKIQEEKGISVDRLALYFDNGELRDQELLLDRRVKNGTTVLCNWGA